MRLPVLKTLMQSFLYIKKNFKVFSLFVCANFCLMVGNEFSGGWTTPAFFVFLFFAYCLWVVFFRLYFNKSPLFSFKHLAYSLTSSSKILLLMFVFCIILVFVPYILAVFGLPLDFFEQLLQNSKLIDFIIYIVFFLCSPFLLYRPYFAWIASVIDKNDNLTFVFNNTKNNYFQMLVLFSLTNALIFTLTVLDVDIWVNCFVSSISFAYFNLVLLKSYEFFFVKES